MSKQGKVSKSKRKGLTTSQKRRGRIVSAIGRWNKKRGKGSRLNRKEFWEVYREVSAKYPNTTEAVKAIRQGKFSMSGKSVKGKAGGRGPKRPTRTKENTPNDMFDEFEWFFMREHFEAVDRGSAKLRNGKVVDWAKLGGYFEDKDVIIFKMSDVAGDDFTFMWPDLYAAYFALRGDTKMAQDIAPYSDKPMATNFSKFSPQPQLLMNVKESVIEEGVFVFDFGLTGTSGKLSGLKKTKETDEVTPLDTEKPSEELQEKREERKKEADTKDKKIEQLEKKVAELEKREKAREAKDRRAGKSRRKRTRKKGRKRR
tara:strand:- start:201 stop:1142 length:942 start_codon:yes stop_codon:yes gene_type:complete